MQISDKLTQIAENELNVYNKGKFAVVEDVDPFYGQEQGLAVVASNVTTVEHEVGVRLSSKNLFKSINEDIPIVSGVKYWLTSGEDPAHKRIAFWLYDANKNELKTLTQSMYGFYYGSSYGFWQSGSDASKLNFSMTFPSEVAYIRFRNAYVDMQFEKSNTATTYTPHVADFSDCKVYTRGKNLLNLEGREVVNFGAGAATTKRTFFNEKAIILGLAVNNNYQNSNYDFELTKNTISCTALGSSYGLGLDVKILPNTTYRFSCSERTPNTSVRLIEYDIEGNYIKNTTIVSNGVTTTENTAWGVFMFKADTANYEHYISNPQLEYGSVITEYEPPITETEYTVAADGIVKGVKSFAPTMTLISENNNSIINANYIKDIDKVFEETIIQIALSGGE